MVRVCSCLLVCAGVGALAGAARADNPPIVNRNYAIDLYDGVAIGSTVMVAMGGTGAASMNGTAGALINPSAIAVRSTTDLDSWSWDYHLDVLTGKYSSDYDNNGVVTGEDSGASLVTGGLGLRFHNWSIATTAFIQRAPVPGASTTLDASASRVEFILGNYQPRFDLAIGAGVQIASFSIADGNNTLFTVSGTGLIFGATWLPHAQSIRIGAAVDLPISGGQVTTTACDPMSCDGYILPDEVDSPARVVGGVAYRIGPTAWNQPTVTRFRDERALTLAADLVVTGATANGYGIEAFSMQQLQRSGRGIAVSPRGGAEFEWLPGRLRLRGGSYWEPSRFDGVGGRLHVTLGLELAILEFPLFGPRRLRLTFTGDEAARYRNIGASIGFWR
jgi:hypothetical protein